MNTWILLFLFPITMIGCASISDEEFKARWDFDKDGIPRPIDCDDHNKNVHPNAIEKCNMIDDNCNGQTDEGVKTPFYHDGDHDGYGWSPSQHAACTPLSEDVTNATDCDDTHANVHPDGTEICDLLDNDCNGQTDEPSAVDAITWHADVDQDGYGSKTVLKKACGAQSGFIQNDGDCNDLDKLVHPNAFEKCNIVDDNCNGQTDEGVLITYYFDSDTDGYGDLSKDVTGCTTPNGYVTNSDDCNDGKKTVHPNAVELCDNNIDENCDGITDNAIEANLWYLDADKDGYGTSAVWIYACVTPTGTVANKTDCDDTNPLVNPNATELCTDQIDNDCNGITDTDAKIVTWYLDKDKDGFGDKTQSKQDCTQPVGYVENATDCSDANASIHPGAQEICNNGTDDNCDESVNQCKLSGIQNVITSQTKIHGNANKLYPDTITVGDINGDGADDLLIGVKNDSSAGLHAGAVYLFLGPILLNNLSFDNADAKWTGEATNDNAGFSIDAEDVDNDGKDDILIGAPSCNNTGCVYLIFGSKNPTGGSLSGASAKWIGAAPNDLAGYSLSMGDVNGDGKNDLLIGAPGSGPGSVYLILGSANMLSGNLSGASAIWTGIAKKDQAGLVVNCTGDFNGDGKKDPLIWIKTTDGATNGNGAVCLILGSANPKSENLSKTAIIWTGEFESDQAGFSISTGNINGDGNDDVLIGAPGNTNKSGYHAGAVYLILGFLNPISKSLSGTDAKWIGETDYDNAGLCSSMGDTNGDGKDDILITSLGNIELGSNNGSAYFMTGSINPSSKNLSGADAKWIGETKFEQLGRGCTLRGDFNGDGYKDPVLISPNHNFNGTAEGMIYIIHSLSF